MSYWVVEMKRPHLDQALDLPSDQVASEPNSHLDFLVDGVCYHDDWVMGLETFVSQIPWVLLPVLNRC
jgi:hypothetical protein